jgi:hypothetical protein
MTPRNPEIWRTCPAFCRRTARPAARDAVEAAEFFNESRKMPEDDNILLTNGNTT